MRYSEKYLYALFGMVIQSELELPGLTICEGQADVTITLGETPQHLDEPLQKTPWYEVGNEKYLLRVNGVADYYVANGKMIVIKQLKTAADELVRLFIPESVIPVLLQQRGFLALHGAVVNIHNKAVALLGLSQTGKSTLAYTFYNREYQVMSDEICAINLANNKAVIYPGIPRLHVWRDALHFADKDCKEYQPVRKGIEKYIVPVEDRFSEEALELGGIIILSHHNKKEINYEFVKGAEKLGKLRQYVNHIESALDKGKQFQLMTETCKSPMMQIAFNENRYPLNEMIDIIRKEMT